MGVEKVDHNRGTIKADSPSGQSIILAAEKDPFGFIAWAIDALKVKQWNR